MSAMKSLHDEFDAALDRVRELFHKLAGETPAVESEIKADVEAVAHDAVAAEAPVAQEAMQDVAAVADHAATASAEPTKQ